MCLWRDADRRGANVPLQSRSSILAKCCDESYEDEAGEDVAGFAEGPSSEIYGGGDADGSTGISRPIGLSYDFIEVCGGSGVVTSALCALGVVCGPILDITYSRHYDLTDGRLIQWVIYLMEQGRLRSFLVAPPCTTFSPAAHPALRSYRVPEGFQRLHPRVHLGNRLAFASLALLFAGLRLRVFGLGEQPIRSKMRWLKQWQRLLVLGAREAFLAACMYGSPHQKEFVFVAVGMQVELLARRRSRNHTHLREFVFVAVGMQVELLARRRSRNHTHLRIEGAYTKPSAIYCEGLASAFATFFRVLTMRQGRDSSLILMA